MSKDISPDLESLFVAHNALLDQIDFIMNKYDIPKSKINTSKLLISGAVNELTGLKLSKLSGKQLKDIEYSVIEVAQGKRNFLLLIRCQSGLGIIDVDKNKTYRFDG